MATILYKIKRVQQHKNVYFTKIVEIKNKKGGRDKKIKKWKEFYFSVQSSVFRKIEKKKIIWVNKIQKNSLKFSRIKWT